MVQFKSFNFSYFSSRSRPHPPPEAASERLVRIRPLPLPDAAARPTQPLPQQRDFGRHQTQGIISYRSRQQNKCYPPPPKCVYLPISKLHSILAVANLLAHNNIICYCGQITLQSAAVKCIFCDIFGVTFILLEMTHSAALISIYPRNTF